MQIDTNIVKQLSKTSDLNIYTNSKEFISTTPRLTLKPFKKDDIHCYYKLFSNAQIMQHYAEGNIRNPDQVDNLMEYYLDYPTPCYFSIFNKNNQNFIGTIFLTPRKQAPNILLLGYLLFPQYWGNNYTKEALYALIFGLKPIIWPHHHKIIATCDQANIASQKILVDFNFQFKETTTKFSIKKLLYSLVL